jgi:hypothetical protein
MDALQFFLLRHESLHLEEIDRLLHGLRPEQIRLRLREDTNSLAWLVWHMARCEDVGVNALVAARRQVLDDGWAARLGVALRDIGTGMTSDEVVTFSSAVDLAALRGYFVAVGARTRDVVAALQPQDLDEVVDPGYLHRVIEGEGILGPHADWVRSYWEGKTRGWFLAQLGLAHQWEHVGEAAAIRGFLGMSSLW